MRNILGSLRNIHLRKIIVREWKKEENREEFKNEAIQ